MEKEKIITQDDINSGMRIGQLVQLKPYTSITVRFEENTYHTLIGVRSNVTRIRSFFREIGLAVGDLVYISYDADSRTLNIRKPRPVEPSSVENEMSSPSGIFQKGPQCFESLKEVSRAGQPGEELSEKDRRIYGAVLPPAFQADAVLALWEEGNTYWALCLKGNTAMLCRQDRGEKRQTVVGILNDGTPWREVQPGLHRLQDGTYLLETNCCLRFFSRDELLESISFPPQKHLGKLYAIEPQGDRRRDWLYVWGEKPDRMTAFWRNGELLPAEALANNPYMEDLITGIRRENWQTHPECLPYLQDRIRYSFDANWHAFQICFWDPYRSSGIDTPIQRALDAMTPHWFYLSLDWKTIAEQDNQAYWHPKGPDPAEGGMPSWAAAVGDVLYRWRLFQALEQRNVSKRPTREEVQQQILAWYPDSHAVALWFYPPRGVEGRYYAIQEEDNPLCFRFHSSLSKLLSGAGVYLNTFRRYQEFLQTEDFLGSRDGCLERLAEVLTGQLRIGQYRRGELFPERLRVSASDLAPLVYGTRQWKRGHSAAFFIDLSSYQYGDAECVQVDLDRGTVERGGNSRIPLWQEPLPKPEGVAQYVPCLQDTVPICTKAPAWGSVQAFCLPEGPNRDPEDVRILWKTVPAGTEKISWDPNDSLCPTLSLYCAHKGGWTRHPTLHSFTAYVLGERGIYYAKDGQVVYTGINGKTQVHPGAAQVLSMKLQGDDLILEAAEGLSEPVERADPGSGERRAYWTIQTRRVPVSLTDGNWEEI